MYVCTYIHYPILSKFQAKPLAEPSPEPRGSPGSGLPEAADGSSWVAPRRAAPWPWMSTSGPSAFKGGIEYMWYILVLSRLYGVGPGFLCKGVVNLFFQRCGYSL